MSNKTLNLNSSLYQYMLSVSLREPPILKSLREETANLPLYPMQISPEQGQFMAFLIELTKPKKPVEIGVYTGYSSLAVALALPNDGRITACDINTETSITAKRFWKAAKIEHKIDLRLAPALETLQQLIARKKPIALILSSSMPINKIILIIMNTH